MCVCVHVCITSVPEWRSNYTSMAPPAVKRQVRKQFEEEKARGFMAVTTLREALKRYGDSLSLAGIGARKEGGNRGAEGHL